MPLPQGKRFKSLSARIVLILAIVVSFLALPGLIGVADAAPIKGGNLETDGCTSVGTASDVPVGFTRVKLIIFGAEDGTNPETNFSFDTGPVLNVPAERVGDEYIVVAFAAEGSTLIETVTVPLSQQEAGIPIQGSVLCDDNGPDPIIVVGPPLYPELEPDPFTEEDWQQAGSQPEVQIILDHIVANHPHLR